MIGVNPKRRQNRLMTRLNPPASIFFTLCFYAYYFFGLDFCAYKFSSLAKLRSSAALLAKAHSAMGMGIIMQQHVTPT
jgi:hypothetical protein